MAPGLAGVRAPHDDQQAGRLRVCLSLGKCVSGRLIAKFQAESAMPAAFSLQRSSAPNLPAGL